MEKYIDLINAYLQKTLSKSEVVAFENRLLSDAEFNSVYNEHLIILGGIERTTLTQEISNARQNYMRTKWLKYFGISVGIILLSIVAYSLITKPQNVENSGAKENNAVEFVSDSTRVEDKVKSKSTIDTIVTEKPISEAKVVVTSVKEKIDIETENPIKNNLFSFFKSNEKQAQIISINTEEDAKVMLKEGTILSIPKNAFVNKKTGNSVSGIVDLKIKEYYKLSDILLANLSTKSDDKILETGGMLFVTARKNDSELKLKPQKEIKIVFNNSGKENMQLFKGVRTDDYRINWKLEQQLESIEIDETEAITQEVVAIDTFTGRIENRAISFQFVEEVPIFPGCENGNNEEKRDCMKTAINKLVNRKFNISIVEDINLTGKQTIRTSFEIDEEGNIGKIEARASQKELAQEAIRVIELMPKLIPGKQEGKAIKVKYYLPITFTAEGIEENDKTTRNYISMSNSDSTVTLRSDNKFQNEIESKSISEISNSELERYTFSTTSLGWINCDRFVRSNKRKIKYKLKIKDAEGANIKMIFKSMNSVLPSRRINYAYNFGDIPINEEVILLAIKKKDNKLYLGIKEVKIKAVSELDIDFNEVTITELKTELYKLNKNF